MFFSQRLFWVRGAWPCAGQPESMRLANVARNALSWTYAFTVVLLFVLFLAYHFAKTPFLTGGWGAFVLFLIYLVGLLMLICLDDRGSMLAGGVRDTRLSTEQGLIVFLIIGFDSLLSILGVIDVVTNRL